MIMKEEDVKIEENLDETSSETTDGDSSFVEKDGDVYLKVDTEPEDSEDPEKEPEKEEESNTKEEAEKGESDEGEAEEPEETVDAKKETEPETYRGKTREELMAMHLAATKKIGEQGSEIGELRKVAKPEHLSDKEIYEKLSSDDITHGLEIEKTKLMEMERYDDEYPAQQKLIASLEKDFIAKKTEEEIQKRFTADDNQRFIEEQKKRFQEQKVEMTSDEYSELTETAKEYSENGRLTEKSYYKALIDKFGTDIMTKHFAMEGEKKARSDIKKAGEKETKTLDVRGSGKNAKLIRIHDMNQHELRQRLDNLSMEELRQLYKRVDK